MNDSLFVINDALDAMLLIMFFFGLAFTGISLLFGAFEGGGGGHGAVGHGHGGNGHGAHGLAHDGHDSSVSILNMGTILAFSTWFGGSTYLLRNGAGIPALLSLAGGLVAGMFGGYMIMRLLTWIKGKETYLDARSERLTGSIGRITSPIREGGTGEIVYEMNGVRQVSAARAPLGISIPRGAEVIVVRRERGVSFVEPWQGFAPGDDWEARFKLEAGSTGERPPP